MLIILFEKSQKPAALTRLHCSPVCVGLVLLRVTWQGAAAMFVIWWELAPLLIRRGPMVTNHNGTPAPVLVRGTRSDVCCRRISACHIMMMSCRRGRGRLMPFPMMSCCITVICCIQRLRK